MIGGDDAEEGGGLAHEDFAEFFSEVHGCSPYKWQSELARTVCVGSGWPRYLDMPTAAGKTCAMDIAVFHLALDAHTMAGREAPLRIAFVVDRRLVVDGAMAHAQILAEALADREKGRVTKMVADALGRFSPDGPPLAVVRLRGGMPVDNDWASTPSQPTIIVSTVDQVGSRLLFRGYGVSDRMRPVHAGLLGRDTLYIVDEAHLSQPFVDTLARVSEMDGGRPFLQPPPIRFTSMSATIGWRGGADGDGNIGHDGSTVFPPPDRADELLLADDRLAMRLDAHKLARLVEAASSADRAETIANEAVKLAYPGKKGKGAADTDDGAGTRPPHRIGVVLNRVALARHVHGILSAKAKERGGDAGRVHLLTGRTRPIERDRVIGPELERILAGGVAGTDADEEKDDDAPSFYVATQCIEAGVDADFDALVTQVAPIDSLRQRFGRLDRTGRRRSSDAAIVAFRDEVAGKAVDPIYGDRLPKAWAYLKGAAEGGIVDFGVFHFPRRNAAMDEASAPRARSAALMPAYVRAWWQTSPRPDPDPDPAVFLHGVGTGSSADVQVVWRADITDGMLREWHRGTGQGGGGVDLGRAGLAVCRPSQLEAVSLPVWIVRRWLEGARSYPLGDIEGGAGGNFDGRGNDVDGAAKGRGAGEPCALLWRDPKDGGTRTIVPGEIRPGDTIIVPASRGGCDKYGWDAKSRADVPDLGMDAALIHRHALTFRLNRPYLSMECAAPVADALARLSVELADEGADAILDAIAATDGIPDEWQHALTRLRYLNRQGGGDGSWGPRTFVSRTTLDDGRPAIAGVGIRLNTLEARTLDRHGQRYGSDCVDIETSYAATAKKARTGRAAGSGRGAAAFTDAAQHPPFLSDHSWGVASMTREFCDRIGIDDGMFGDLAVAAELHDAGKAERRVQALLRRVDPDCLPDGARPVAKSLAGMGAAGDRGGGYAEYMRALDMAHLPMGHRHECWSVKMAEAHPALDKAHDRDVVLYAIGTHHGYGRPLFPPVLDRHAAAGGTVEWTLNGVSMSAPVDHGLGRLGSGWVDLCERLYRRYGPWRLAHIEAVVRLADHCQSRAEGGMAGGE